MILDTNAVSAVFEGDPALARRLEGWGRHHLPVIVVGEFAYGLENSRTGRTLAPLLARLVQDSEILHVDLETAEHYAAVRNQLKRNGTPIPENDVWIAALARQHHLPIVSRDRHFDHVRSVTRLDW